MNGTFLLIGYIVIFGIFGIIQKYTSNNMTWQTHMMWIWISAMVFNSIFVFRKASFVFNKYSLICIGLGFLACLGTICMYKALKLETLSKVHILTNFVFILPVLSSFLIYGETFSVKKIISICFAIISIILMA